MTGQSLSQRSLSAHLPLTFARSVTKCLGKLAHQLLQSLALMALLLWKDTYLLLLATNRCYVTIQSTPLGLNSPPWYSNLLFSYPLIFFPRYPKTLANQLFWLRKIPLPTNSAEFWCPLPLLYVPCKRASNMFLQGLGHSCCLIAVCLSFVSYVPRLTSWVSHDWKQGPHSTSFSPLGENDPSEARCQPLWPTSLHGAQCEGAWDQLRAAQESERQKDDEDNCASWILQCYIM